MNTLNMHVSPSYWFIKFLYILKNKLFLIFSFSKSSLRPPEICEKNSETW